MVQCDENQSKKKLIKFLSHRHWDYSKLHLKKKTIDTVEELIDILGNKDVQIRLTLK